MAPDIAIGVVTVLVAIVLPVVFLVGFPMVVGAIAGHIIPGSNIRAGIAVGLLAGLVLLALGAGGGWGLILWKDRPGSVLPEGGWVLIPYLIAITALCDAVVVWVLLRIRGRGDLAPSER